MNLALDILETLLCPPLQSLPDSEDSKVHQVQQLVHQVGEVIRIELGLHHLISLIDSVNHPTPGDP